VRKAYNAVACETIAAWLKDQKMEHLGVLSRGNHLVIYSEEMGEKVSRVRFTRIGDDTYELGIADHLGRWEPTPFTGTLPELFALLTTQFSWLLSDL